MVILLSLGSNIQPRRFHMQHALSQIDIQENLSIKAISKLYQSPAWGNTQQDDFLNICLQIDTNLSPHQLLLACQTIEQKVGRQRDSKTRWQPRHIDIDILTYYQTEIDTADLVLPHPFMTQRAFVLLPLHDILSDGFIIQDKPLSDWIADLPSAEKQAVVPIGDI